MPHLYSDAGQRLALGRELGRGGEGAIYELSGGTMGLVAKVYSSEITAAEQYKLGAMVAMCTPRLRQVAAWPVGTVRTSPRGPVRGYLMDALTGQQPVHNLYNPRSRKEHFPTADWAFLALAARNVAVAFETIHAHGHIMADVNHGNVLVSSSATVRLIDCGSFQIWHDGSLFRCNVGVSHFTPPELQGTTDFSRITRTTNHDNFGLALLVFHLLFMGRHPYAGVQDHTRGEVSLEGAIGHFRYAYASDTAARKISRPPGSPPPNIVTNAVRSCFDRAFTELGARDGARPTAAEWVRALDELRGAIHTCGRTRVHKFIGELSSCPWCLLEGATCVVLFLDGTRMAAADPLASTLDMRAVWLRIQAIPRPLLSPPIGPASFKPTPSKTPARVDALVALGYLTRAGIGALSILLVIWLPLLFWLWIPLGLILAFAVIHPKAARHAEERRRRAALSEAESKWADFSHQWASNTGAGQFASKLAGLEFKLKSHQGLKAKYESEVKKLHDSARSHQLRKFLDRYSVEYADIPDIGPSRKAALVSFGVESAADVTHARVSQVPGFGPHLTTRLLEWRKSLEQGFRFDSAHAVDPADIAALKQRISAERQLLEAALRAGPEELTALADAAKRAQAELGVQMERLASSLAQAQADASAS